MKEVFTGVFKEEGNLYTISKVPGEKVYGETLIEKNNIEYRRWDPSRSKPAAAIMNNLNVFPIERDSRILYLGAASGTTVSHFSDILGPEGFIHAIEFAPQVTKSLVKLSQKRENIAPILADARRLNRIGMFLSEANVIYQDIAQRDQSEILIRNSERFLDSGDHAIVAIKSQSISSSIDKREIFDQEIDKLSDHFEIIEKTELEPYEKDHLFVVLKKK